MKSQKLQFEKHMEEYMKYAAYIEHMDVEDYLAKLQRDFKHLDPRLKRGKCPFTLQSFADREILDTVERYEEQEGLYSSLTYGQTKSALSRAWNRMLENRARTQVNWIREREFGGAVARS